MSNKTKTKLGAMLTVTAMLSAAVLPITASAETIAKGKIGKYIEWSLTDTGALSIWGSGDMTNWTRFDHGYAPWVNQGANLKTVTIGDGITSIGSWAFCFNNQELTSVTIPNSVTYIGEGALSGCSALADIDIPDSVRYIGKDAMSGCTSLTEITIPYGVTSIYEDTFSSCHNLTRVTIPDSVTSIGNYAFASCHALESITIPDSVTSIGAWAFLDCRSMKSFTFPNSITIISQRTLMNCGVLTSVTIPRSVTYIAEAAANGCGSLSDVYYDGYDWEWNDITFEGNNTELLNANVHFRDSTATSGTCGKNLRWTLDDEGTLAITGEGDMTNWVAANRVPWRSVLGDIKNVTIGDDVTSIGTGAFYGCSSLTSVTIGDSVTSIGDYAFYECSSLASMTFGNSLKSIGKQAFCNCRLTSITLGKSLTNIGNTAFASCRVLRSIYYSGTREQWSGVTKGSSWNFRSPIVVYVLGETTVPSEVTCASGSAANGATGFAAEIEADNDDLGNVVWKVTSGGETRATAGMSYGGTVTGPVRIGLVVAGLYDENATAAAAYGNKEYVKYTE